MSHIGMTGVFKSTANSCSYREAQSGVAVLYKHKNWRRSQQKCCFEDFLFSKYAAFLCFRKCLQRCSTAWLQICKPDVLGLNWGELRGARRWKVVVWVWVEDEGPRRRSDSALSLNRCQKREKLAFTCCLPLVAGCSRGNRYLLLIELKPTSQGNVSPSKHRS